ncbi:AraD1 family protein [Croceicoccus hydrothermalis]|uniref:AraD1 family protein n=1 Tax=Croceicoccus hydrothermalis TaxID=2867964 RepID=UPI001EFB8ECE|nr:AraD1 family protein [Croceicoccus hydrothermalis]
MTRSRLLQHRADDGARRVILAEGDEAFVLENTSTVLDLAKSAIAAGTTLKDAAKNCTRGRDIDLQAELAAGRLLAPVDHADPAHLLLTGTGLTHLGSAEGRNKMHLAAQAKEDVTDSMRMFLEGLEGGKPKEGETGQQPEWFYKGDGSQLIGPRDSFTMPHFAQDGSEEPELAGIYLIGDDGTPHRLGIAIANEFSDHVTERHNYLWLAHSKLRQAALGAELLLGDPPSHVEGTSRILRDGEVLWEKRFLSGEDNMSHSLHNLEQHHFKYAQFQRPGDVHVHFFGTATLSFAEGVTTQEGDVFEISAEPFSLPLSNPLARAEHAPVTVMVL